MPRIPQRRAPGSVQPFVNINPEPIISLRAPTSNDTGYEIATQWIQTFNTSGTAINAAWLNTGDASGSANWINLTGGAGTFSSLTVNGDSTLTGTTNINTTGTAATDIGNTTGAVTITAPNLTMDVLNALVPDGNLKLQTAGNKLFIAVGSNASIGQSAAMTAGTITISTTAVTASSLIFLTYANVGGTQGSLSVGTITAGTSFVINSSSGTDTSKVNWWIIN